MTEENGGVYVSRSNKVLGAKSRYRPRIYSKKFPAILDLLSKPEMGFIMQEVAPPVQGAARSTVIRIGPSLLRRIEDHELDVHDFSERPHGETRTRR